MILSCSIHILCFIFIIYRIDNDSNYIVMHNKNNHIITTLLLYENNTVNNMMNDKYISVKSKSLVDSKNLVKTKKLIDKTMVKNFNKIEDSISYKENSMDQNSKVYGDSSTHSKHFQSSITDSNDVIDSKIQQSHIIKCVYPEYPKEAKALKIEGKVIVMYDINHIGKIEKIRIIASVPTGIFEKNIKIAMRRWIYKSNNPKKDMTVIFKFSLNTVQMLESQKK